MGRPPRRRGHEARAGDEVIEVDIASDDADLLVVTENGWGKRTRVSDYPREGPRHDGREDRRSSSRPRARSPVRASSATATR